MRFPLNEKGFSLVEAIVVGTVGIIGISIYFAFSTYQFRSTRLADRKLAAEHAASELLELFRAMGNEGLKNYLADNKLPLCKAINLPNHKGKFEHTDSQADAKALQQNLRETIYRGYEVRVVDMKTLEKTNNCTTNLSSTEMFLVKAIVSWGKESITLSTVIPRTPVECPNYASTPPPLEGASWHSFSDDFMTDPNRNSKWRLNRHYTVARNSRNGYPERFTCQWTRPGEFGILEPGDEQGFGCQMIVNEPGFRPGPEWNASYDFSISEGDDCADEMVFLWNTDSWTDYDGGGTGFQSFDYFKPRYYGFRADVYRNGAIGPEWNSGNTTPFPAEPASNFYAVFRGIYANNSPGIYAHHRPNRGICDGRWRRVELSYAHDRDSSGKYTRKQSGNFTAKVDGVEIINTQLSCVDYQFPYFALYARSGEDSAHIRVKNLRINSKY